MKNHLNLRNFLALLIVVGAAALILAVIRNHDRLSPGAIIETVKPEADLALRRIHYTETRDGVRRWTLDADSALHDMSEGVTHIENVRVAFHPENNGADTTLTARKGTVMIEKGELLVEGDVVVISPDGYTVETESLEYREAERQISTRDPVRLFSEEMEMTGTGMVLNIHEQTFILLTDVHARLNGLTFARRP
jgi:LPS export ABC transporter protein LptC